MSLLSTESKLITMPVLPNTMRTITEAFAPLRKASLQVLFYFCWLGLLVLLSPTFCSRLHFYLYTFHLLYFLYCNVVFVVLHCWICCIALLHLLPLPPFLFLCITASSVSLFSINNRPRLGNLKATVAVEGNCGPHITLDSWRHLFWANPAFPLQHSFWTFNRLILLCRVILIENKHSPSERVGWVPLRVNISSAEFNRKWNIRNILQMNRLHGSKD